MKACFTGAQGTGKTTLLEELQQDTDLQQYVFKKSFTRELLEKGYKINQDGDDATQVAVMTGHEAILAEANSNTIFDRCAIDGYVYTLYLYTQGNVTKDTLDTATNALHRCLSSYDIIFYLIPEFNPEADGVRSDDVTYRDSIATLFQQTIDFIIEENLCKVVFVKGTVEDRIRKIKKHLVK